MNIQKILIVAIGCQVLLSCADRKSPLLLKLSTLEPGIGVDTIEVYPERKILLVNLIHHLTMDRFSMNYAVIKHSELHGSILFTLQEPEGLSGRVSSRYISFVKPSDKLNWGWFSMLNGKIVDSLPAMRHIVDSLQQNRSQDVFVKEINGYIEEMLHGKKINEMNYGQFVIPKLTMKVDSLPYSLYQLKNGTLNTISTNPEDLFKQDSGIFFIPPPGYGMVSKYDKKNVIAIVDSAARLAKLPLTISVDEVP